MRWQLPDELVILMFTLLSYHERFRILRDALVCGHPKPPRMILASFTEQECQMAFRYFCYHGYGIEATFFSQLTPTVLEDPMLKYDVFVRSICADNHIEVIMLLIKKGVIQDLTSVLICATRHAHIGITKFVLNRLTLNGIRPEAIKIFRNACRSGDVETIEQLLDFGITIDYLRNLVHEDKSKYASESISTSVIQILAYKGHIDATRLLLGRGITLEDLRQNYNDVLAIAVEEGYLGMVQLLLQHGLTVDDVLDKNPYINSAESAVYLASYYVGSGEGDEILLSLLQVGVPVSEMKRLQIANPACEHGFAKSLKYMFDQGVTLNDLDNIPASVRRICIRDNNRNLLEVLIHAGLTLHEVTQEDITEICTFACVSMITRILQLAPTPEEKWDTYSTALWMARQNDDFEAVEKLLLVHENLEATP